MIRLHEAPVGPEEIDSLGHMNMRYYGTRAAAAARALMGKLGLGDIEADGLTLIAQDSFNHYLKEQFSGATLVVDGGVSDVRADGLSVYLELINPANGDRAATFIMQPALYRREDRAPVALPKAVIEAANSARVEIPAHGKPRSLDLATPRTDARLSALDRALGKHNFPFGPRGDARIPEEECDEYGFLNLTCAQDIMFSMFAAHARAAGMRQGPPIERRPDGLRMGWAMLENRQYLVATPRANDRIKTLSAPVALGKKTQQMRRWSFNADTGALLSVIDGVSIGLDLDARKAIDIPDDMRAELEAQMESVKEAA